MGLPTEHNFRDHYQGNGLEPFNVVAKHSSGEPIDLTGSKVLMQLKTSRGILGWEFSTDAEADTQLTVTSTGLIQFPLINEWAIPPTTYVYDLQVTDPNGFVTTFLRGTWKVVPNTGSES